MKWPNLFLYISDAGGNTGGNVTYSKVPQHTWKAGELIRDKYWNNLKEAPPMFKKITITSQTDTVAQFNISYEYAEKILLNGGILFVVNSETASGITRNNIFYITLEDFNLGRYNGGYQINGYWQHSVEGGYLQFINGSIK